MTTTSTRTASKRQATSGDTAAVAAVSTAARTLGLPTVRDRLEEHLASAHREQLTYAAFLADILGAECDDRAERRRYRRVREAGFPRPKRLEQFDFDANPTINPATIHTLAAGAWITTGSPLCLIGDSGPGEHYAFLSQG